MLVAPALLLGAFVYWTLALGLGAVSLSGVRSLEQADLQLMLGAAPLVPSQDDEESPCIPADDMSVDGTETETIAVDVVGGGAREDGLATPSR